MDRPTAIRKSLTAFGWGIAACVPFVGLIPAICAVWISEQVLRRSQDWNPASHYLKLSRWLALLGVVITLLVTFAVACARVESGPDVCFGDNC
jgi:uncharacterized BrkB/YihY/UPF0761 family membrane protein